MAVINGKQQCDKECLTSKCSVTSLVGDMSPYPPASVMSPCIPFVPRETQSVYGVDNKAEKNRLHNRRRVLLDVEETILKPPCHVVERTADAVKYNRHCQKQTDWVSLFLDR